MSKLLDVFYWIFTRYIKSYGLLFWDTGPKNSFIVRRKCAICKNTMLVYKDPGPTVCRKFSCYMGAKYGNSGGHKSVSKV